MLHVGKEDIGETLWDNYLSGRESTIVAKSRRTLTLQIKKRIYATNIAWGISCFFGTSFAEYVSWACIYGVYDYPTIRTTLLLSRVPLGDRK
jgi:hypothetical protein